MKRIVSVAMAMVLCVSLCLTLSACGGGSSADKEYQEWAKTGLERLEEAAADYKENASGAQTSDDSIEYAYEYMAVLEEEEALLSEIDESKLSEANRKAYAEQMQNLRDGIEGLEAGIEQLQWQADAAAEGATTEAAEAAEPVEQQEAPQQAEASEASGSSGGSFYVGSAGNLEENMMIMIALGISEDGTQCVFACGNPGASEVVMGRFENSEYHSTIYPLDGGDPIDLKLTDNGDGSITFETKFFEGPVSQASEAEFNEVLNMLS